MMITATNDRLQAHALTSVGKTQFSTSLSMNLDFNIAQMVPVYAVVTGKKRYFDLKMIGK
ncbi:MAG: hypothetical protein ABSF34_19490 [Verrucomicrobiota bacterium]